MFTWFDITILAIITASSMLGAYRGLAKVTISLLGFIFSIILAYYLSSYINEVISRYFINHIALVISSGSISYIISWSVCSFLTHKFLLMIAFISGGVVDRTLGLGVGVFRGMIICLFLFLVLTIFFSGSYLQAKTLKDVMQNTTIDKYPEWLKESTTTPYLDQLSKNFIKTLPQNSLESIKLPIKSEIIDTTNVLKKSQSNEYLDKVEKLPEELRQELDEVLSQELEKDD
ncbi:CvpA family protein [Rickettsia endosymbiont of Oedothorax gibbosus]|uniref:CvpA family protein n=1 Tax=Rickettsia endosymbiont of Oedothorax gibbosus TaxID=931099 RepID=UPI002023C76D|nr:CvpA family protein [Rickettsia endosymbiont of Oedothorax gibbosus]